MDRKIDIFNHVMPAKYLDMMKLHLKDPGILMEGYFSHRQLEQLARKIVDVVEAPFNIDGRVVEMSTSIGISTFPPSTSWEELLSSADAAMYEAKSIGRGAFVVAPVKAEQRARLVWTQARKPREAS